MSLPTQKENEMTDREKIKALEERVADLEKQHERVRDAVWRIAMASTQTMHISPFVAPPAPTTKTERE